MHLSFLQAARDVVSISLEDGEYDEGGEGACCPSPTPTKDT